MTLPGSETHGGMLTLPRQAPAVQWHRQLAWRTYVQELFRLVSRRRDFTTEFRRLPFTAGVLPEQRRLLLDPALLSVPPLGVRFDPGDEYGRRVTLLRSIASHEGGHVVFSGRKPEEQRLGWLWNALEDERMERLVMRRFPELCADFDFLGDVLWLGDHRPQVDLQTACLVWRWAHDRPDVPFAVPLELEGLWREQVRPLVEEAWEAHRDDVMEIARAILEVLPEELREEAEPGLGADGGGMSGVQPEEPQQPVRGKGKRGDEETAEAGSGGPGSENPIPEDISRPGTSGAGELPGPPPAPVATAPDRLLLLTEGYARRLAPLLAPPGRPARQEAHRSRGRFRYDRHVQGAERPFRRRVGEDRPVPFLLRLCVDLSTSMSGERLRAAREAAFMLARAAHLARSRLQVIGFTSSAHEIVPPDLPWQEAAARLVGLEAGGGTQLSRGLELALQGCARPDEQEILIVITDGELLPADVRTCGLLLDDQRPYRRTLAVVPILIGESVQFASSYLDLFGAAYPVMTLDEVSRTVQAALTTLRARLRT
ncbi:Zn-dependent peptidase [Deinococcus aerius]|uniref:Zn-dependent peptidase n=2 Tax=Deinococcus aerius TaxID=200253 RepID=A0A2I9DQY6_9DEIO|nr:Zn-dependent peptidase [Deinococcus aerius]